MHEACLSPRCSNPAKDFEQDFIFGADPHRCRCMDSMGWMEWNNDDEWNKNVYWRYLVDFPSVVSFLINLF